jgi:hypothetical protein
VYNYMIFYIIIGHRSNKIQSLLDIDEFFSIFFKNTKKLYFFGKWGGMRHELYYLSFWPSMQSGIGMTIIYTHPVGSSHMSAIIFPEFNSSEIPIYVRGHK